MSADATISNARVLTCDGLSEPRSVAVRAGIIVDEPVPGAPVVEAAGGALIPGLIDTHVHVAERSHLEALTQWGVTTALDMGSWPISTIRQLQQHPGLCELRSAGTPAIGVAGLLAQMPGFPADAVIHTPAQAREFVQARVGDRVDHIKMITEAAPPEGLDPASADAIVDAAHEHGLRVIAHALTAGAYRFAVEHGADVITHVPLDGPLDDGVLDRMVSAGQVVSPTLTMMAGCAEAIPSPSVRYENGQAAVRNLREAGVPILAGTDANATPGVPFSPPHGESLHEELERLVDAGLTPLEALRGATDLAAEAFGLHDRGSLTPGQRADLVLIDGDPTQDITATRRIRGVWLAGQQVR